MKNKTIKNLTRNLTKVLAGVMLVGSVGAATPVYAAEVDSMRREGLEAYDNGEYEKAIEIFEKLIAEGSDTYVEKWYIGNCYRALNYLYTATEYFEETWENKEGATAPQLAMFAGKWSSNEQDLGLSWYVEQIYEIASEKELKDLSIEFSYALALKEEGKYFQALHAFDMARVRCTGEYETINRGIMEIHQADCYLALREYDKALELYESGYEKCQKEGMYLDGMTKYYLDREVMTVDQFVQNFLQNKTNAQIASFLNEKGYYKEAITYFETAQAEGQDVRFDLALAYNSAGEHRTAVEMLEQLLLEEPENTAYMNSLGAIYCDKLGEYDKANELFDRALSINPDLNGIEGNKAVVAVKAGNFDEEESIRKSLLERYPTYGSMIKSYLSTLNDLDYETATERYSNYVDWPEDVERQAIIIAEMLSTSNMSVESEENFLSYFKMCDPDNNNYYACRAQAYLLYDLGRYDEALAMWDICESLDSGIMSYEVASGKAYCYKEMGDVEKAMEYYRQSYEIFPGYEQVEFEFDLYMKAGQPERAKEQLDNNVSMGVKEADVAYLYMIWAGYVDNYEALLKYADMVLEDVPTSVKAKAYKAVALQNLGKTAEAEAVIADIDSITYSCTDTNKMIADSVLGRLDSAKDIYKALLERYPGSARSLKNDYQLKNLFTDAEFCKMAGRDLPTASAAGIAPFAIGGGVLAVVGGILAALFAKRRKDDGKKGD